MRVIPGNAQHIGDRESQQDAFGFGTFGDHAFERHGGAIMVLCDGMGGLANGAAASRAAVDAVLSGYRQKQPSEDISSALNRVLRDAQQAVCATSGDGEAAGTTIVVAVVCQDRLYWASLGDSRLYLCRNSAPAAQLTEDHNVASLLTKCGEGSVKEAARTTNPEALTAYLGSPYPPQPHVGRDVALLPGDRIVACSDGLYRGLSPEGIAASARVRHPMKAAERMVEAVREQRIPHQDNMTVVLFELASRQPLAEFFKLTNPARRNALYGAAGGFSAAVAVAGILFLFGVLKLSLPDRHAKEAAIPPQIPPAALPQNSEPVTPAPAPTDRAASGQQTTGVTSAPPTTKPTTDQLSTKAPPTEQTEKQQHTAQQGRTEPQPERSPTNSSSAETPIPSKVQLLNAPPKNGAH